MEPKPNTYYKMRGGLKAYVAFKHPHREFNCWVGYIDGCVDIQSWQLNGKYSSHNEDDNRDLDIEWVEPAPLTALHVHAGHILRRKGSTYEDLILFRDNIMVTTSQMTVGYAVLIEDFEISRDGGKTFHPCHQ